MGKQHVAYNNPKARAVLDELERFLEFGMDLIQSRRKVYC